MIFDLEILTMLATAISSLEKMCRIDDKNLILELKVMQICVDSYFFNHGKVVASVVSVIIKQLNFILRRL